MEITSHHPRNLIVTSIKRLTLLWPLQGLGCQGGSLSSLKDEEVAHCAGPHRTRRRMSDWGQGFPRDPPGMLPIPHLPREEDGAVGERHRTEGRCPDLGALKRPLYPEPPPQEGPGP